MPPPPLSPSDEEIRVAIEALRSDAREWLDWADALAHASTVVGRLDLTANEMCALSEIVGLPETYAALQRRVAELATQGAAGFTAMAGALIAAADGYERDERNAVHRMLGAW
ncbi:hypothetical protein [Phytohabitans rumicis]|uniref:ESX-1 secretion-associated protein n=1 Tax=Phytohabitans rumicis TaxID=1076125 RepID=A0A6V8L1P1_9ACTN|nr:hypothetical protein [Phytohabitans rumicis]GFJ88027.1 hypothetical protein Prum_016690 [Phytohabitans rumicis]